ncbi:hypothetical protein [Streptomyces sp. LS1784]|uniref:hypothetical protein n=1 Tax=Streptomyces sp. LS1784 TaxID=2851533 RepID=UPI0027DFFAB2|nr:hypothetical protein [Streptomyces sp. LS1784]
MATDRSSAGDPARTLALLGGFTADERAARSATRSPRGSAPQPVRRTAARTARTTPTPSARVPDGLDALIAGR